MATPQMKSDSAIDAAPFSTIEGKAETTDTTTTFIDDANVVTSQVLMPKTVPKDLYMSNEDNYIQDIKTFLAKPVRLRSSGFVPGQSVSTFSDISMPSTLFGEPMVANKLLGYFGIRATMVFRLTVNATRFDTGRYIMAFIYTGGVNVASNTSAAFSVNAHKASLVQRTQLPHVEVDLNCDTSAELRVPFISAYNHVPLQNNYAYGDVGVLHMSPYAVPGAGTSAIWTLYVHLEDVELFGSVRPQSLSQKEASSSGRVTSVLSKLKGLTDTLKNFPTLSSYAEPASWVLDIGANAAKAVGWSKPISEEPTKRVIRDCAPFLCNVDAVDTSKMQAVFNTNSVGILPGFSGTEIDELAISSIATRPAWFRTIDTWNTDATGGTLLNSINVAPYVETQIHEDTLVVPNTYQNYTPVQFSAAHFKYWRGSMVYKFKFIKTEFHSGRLMFAFFPNDTSVALTATSFSDSHYVHRSIIDLRYHNEYTVTIPYMSNTPYREVYGSSAYIGTLAIYVEDSLKAPDTVPQDVRILVEHAAGPDIEFAFPINKSFTPVYNITPQSALRNDCSLANEMLGSSKGIVQTLVNSEACVGERILSFRSMLKGFNLNMYQTAPTAAKFMNILPFGVPSYYYDATPSQAETTGDLYTQFASIFLFSRGSIRIKALGCSASSTNPTVSTTITLETSDLASYSNLSANNLLGDTNTIRPRLTIPHSLHLLAQNGIVEVQLPQYLKTHSRINSDHLVTTGTLLYRVGPTSTATPYGVSISSSGNFVAGEAVFYRAMGDDGNFGQFISIPPMTSALFRNV